MCIFLGLTREALNGFLFKDNVRFEKVKTSVRQIISLAVRVCAAYSSHWVPSDLLRRLSTAPNPVPITQWKTVLHSKL